MYQYVKTVVSMVLRGTINTTGIPIDTLVVDLTNQVDDDDDVNVTD
jgi:antitoxin component of RelBE/YafQ-DinJ toxin-antitoxin module